MCAKTSRFGLAEQALVCIIDDDESVRRSLLRLFRSVHVAAEAFASAQEYLERPLHDGPSCLVLDMCMPGRSGLELQHTLTHPEVQVIFLTGHGDIPGCAEAMKSGAVDFLTKPARDQHLFAAVERALARSDEARQAMAERTAARALLSLLTPREFEVMQRVIAGSPNKLIACDLGTAEKTVKIHRSRVMEKMRATSVASLVRVAQRASVSPVQVDVNGGGSNAHRAA